MKKFISILLAVMTLCTLLTAMSITAAEPQKVSFIASPEGKPIVIIKVDDLGVKTTDSFNQVYEMLRKHDIVASYGAISQRCETLSEAQWNLIKSWVDNGFEIWHHGYAHDGVYEGGVFQNNADFIGRSAEEMEMYLNHGIDLFAKHGITIQSVGAPYNKTDATFAEVVNTKFAGKITSAMYCSSGLNIPNLTNRLNIEVDKSTPLEAVTKSYEGKPGQNYYVVQLHASKHAGEAGIAALEEGILYLKNVVGAVFMTPTDYVNYCIEAANKPKEKDVIEVVDETAIGGNIRVVYNGKDVDFTQYDNVYPVIENGRTLIPIRALSETVGAKVGWLEATQKITITKDNATIYMFIGNPIATVNSSSVTLDVPPATINGRTMVPLRFASESLGLEVKFTQK